MRGFALVVLFVVGAVAPADAEKAKAKESAKVYNRAGEQGQIVIKVKEGQVMRIDRKEGRWLKVRVLGRTGWIPRSKVDVLEEDEMVRNTRRRPFVDGRSVKRGFGGGTGPDDRVGADATDDKTPKGDKDGGGSDADDPDDADDTEKPTKPTKPTAKPAKPAAKPAKAKPSSKEDDEDTGDTDGEEPKSKGGADDEGGEVKDDRPTAHVKKKTSILAEADSEADESFAASTSTKLYPTGKKKGKYTEVENDDGDLGYVLTSSIEVSEGDSEGSVANRGPRQIDLRGRVGVTIIKQGFRSAGATGEDYNLSTSAATIALGGTYLTPYSKDLLIGGELAFDVAKAFPGISAPMNKTTGITVYNINARAMIGKDLKRKSGMIVFGRLGFRYYSYQVSDVGNLMENTAKLPSEIIKAPTLGGALAIPRLTDKIGLRFSLDVMVIGASMEQTKGLEDGTKASAKGVCPGVGFTYRWKPNMDINAGYDLSYTSYDFGAPLAGSMRVHTGTAITRTDIFHGVTVGVAKAF